MIVAVALVIGAALGSVITVFVFARDPAIIRLAKDEVVIKRPNQDCVLIQVPPAVARQVINTYGGDKDDRGVKTEARSIYSEKYNRAVAIANAAEQKKKT